VAKGVAKVLAGRGFLAVGSEGAPQVKVRLPGFAEPVRVYVLRPAIFGDPDTAPNLL